MSIGNTRRQTHILVDGGLAKGTKALAPYIRALSEAGKALDLVVVTHVDNDHISGILSLFRNDFINKDFVKEVWFNGKASSSQASVPAALKVGFEQGNKLSKLLHDKSVAFRSVIGDGNTTFVDDMCKVYVLAPSSQALERANADWDSHDSLKVGSEIPAHDVPWAEFNDEDLIEDHNSTNRSSIVLYIEGRHSVGIRANRAGGRKYGAQEMFGHSSLQSQDVYRVPAVDQVTESLKSCEMRTRS